MTTSSPARTDEDIQSAVQEELDWTPDVDAAGIGVAVEDGAVSLSGEVDSYAEEIAAKRAALRVRGVNAVVDNLVVHPKSSRIVSEVDIAKEVDHALEWATDVPPNMVKAEIKNHVLTLTGQVDWEFQRHAAQRAVQYLNGVHSVRNQITLKPRVTSTDTERRIRGALIRNAQIDANTIDATVSGNTVTLTGTVRSWAEKKQAGQAAWASPHVTHVDNRITVQDR